jgi:hypothetical protein
MKITKKFLIGAGIFIAFILLIITNQNQGNKEKIKTEENQTQLSEEEIKNETTVQEDNRTIADSNESTLADNESMAAEIETTAEEAAIDQKLNPVSEAAQTEINKLIDSYYDISEKIDEELLMAEGDNDEQKEIESITKKREVIEAYQNINTTIKPGLDPNTYVAFTTYDMKLYNIETLVPGMSLLYIISDDKGKLYLYNDTLAENVNQYIEDLMNGEDIKKMIEEVNTQLTDAVAEDASLEEFIKYLKTLS